ncbi:MAG: DUF1015 family protein, partial [Actinobacteria bacterium]|nr:DUF1015 family protein [Actinomycetota bacterium]
MPLFLPFRALRYSSSHSLGDVTAPPYDVLSAADRVALASQSEHNVVHVDLPEGPEPYRHAAQLLADWQQRGVLVLDERPSFTLYRMRFTDSRGDKRNTVGVIGALEVVDEGAEGVLPHEQTTPKA